MAWPKGKKKKNSPESIEKMRIKALGRKHTKETKDKLSLIMKKRDSLRCGDCGRLMCDYGHVCPDKAWNKGIKMPQISGENHYLWRGGCSGEYSGDWTDDLKNSIRKRNSFICYMCGVHQDELDRKLDVHHIDYNKLNCNPNNLVSLCRACHLKTNANREYWIEYFKDYA